MALLNKKQLAAIGRLNREFSILKIEVENVDDGNKKLYVVITLDIKSQKAKAFYLDEDGELAGVVKAD